jgi:hypothetical protein
MHQSPAHFLRDASSWALVLSLLLAPCATEGFAQGQRNTAAILGVVTDASAAAVPSASVTVTNEETGGEYKTVSEGLGNFIVPNRSQPVRGGEPSWRVSVWLVTGVRINKSISTPARGA